MPMVNNNPNRQGRTTRSSRRGGGYLPPTDKRVWGDIGSGFRADAQRVIGVSRRAPCSLFGTTRRTGTSGGRRTRRQLQPVRNTTIHHVVRQSGHQPRANITISTVGANVTVQRQNLGRPRFRDSRPMPRQIRQLALHGRYPSITPRSSERHQPRAGREVLQEVPKIGARTAYDADPNWRPSRLACSSWVCSSIQRRHEHACQATAPGPRPTPFRIDDHARHRTQRRCLLWRAEPLRPGIHRRHAADDDTSIADAVTQASGAVQRQVTGSHNPSQPIPRSTEKFVGSPSARTKDAPVRRRGKRLPQEHLLAPSFPDKSP